MSRQSMPIREAEKIAIKIADEFHVEFVGVELVKEPTGRFLRFFIDKPDGISLSEIETFHRRLQPLVENVDYDYMEVSSPGVDRPLKTPRDFERAQGFAVELKTYKPVDGAKLFRGDLVGLEDGFVVIETAPGETKRFEQKDVAVVKRLIEFDESDLSDDAPADENK